MLPQPRRAALSTAPRRPCCRPAAVAATSRLRLCAGRLRLQAPPRRCGGDGAPRTAVLASGESGWVTRTALSGGACWLRSKPTARPAQREPNGLTDTPGAPPAGPSHRARAQDHPPRAPGRGRALSRPNRSCMQLWRASLHCCGQDMHVHHLGSSRATASARPRPHESSMPRTSGRALLRTCSDASRTDRRRGGVRHGRVNSASRRHHEPRAYKDG